MCSHPRCGKRGVFRLKNTEYGPQMDLCHRHGPHYYKNHGGELILLYPFSEDSKWQDKLNKLKEEQNA